MSEFIKEVIIPSFLLAILFGVLYAAAVYCVDPLFYTPHNSGFKQGLICGFKDGQIAAIRGNIYYYEIPTQSGETVWVYVEEGIK